MKSFLVLLFLALHLARAASPILHQDFETVESGWVTTGRAATLRVTHDPANVKTGKSALAFAYTAEPKKFSVALLPLTDILLANMRTIRFWLKTDSATAIAVILSEKEPGGRPLLGNRLVAERAVAADRTHASRFFVDRRAKRSPR